MKGCKFATFQELEDAFDEEMGLITAEEYRNCMLNKWPSRWRKCLAYQGCYFEGMN